MSVRAAAVRAFERRKRPVTWTPTRGGASYTIQATIRQMRAEELVQAADQDNYVVTALDDAFAGHPSGATPRGGQLIEWDGVTRTVSRAKTDGDESGRVLWRMQVAT